MKKHHQFTNLFDIKSAFFFDQKGGISHLTQKGVSGALFDG